MLRGESRVFKCSKGILYLKPNVEQLHGTELDNLLLTSEEENELDPFLRRLEKINSIMGQLQAEGMTIL